jgi:signal transduction histidine kinase
VRLPWLAPGASALASLARADHVAVDRHLRHDPGLALLWLNAGASAIDDNFECAPLLRCAFDLLNQPPAGRLDETLPPVAVVLDVARLASRAAEQLATKQKYIDVRRAAVAGLLAPLGWLAIAAVDPTGIEACLTDQKHTDDPDGTQVGHWGASAATITRRLLRQWNLPHWLAASIGNLDLPPAWSREIDGDVVLTEIVHRAVRSLIHAGDPLRLAGRVPPTDIATDELPNLEAGEFLADPYSTPYLRDLVGLALQPSTDGSRTACDRLEAENEALRRALRGEHASFADRLRSQKLAALAEFAAGAGHEINNPLAVISGQAQYLMIKETEPDREKALLTVVQQAQRIHRILTDLMQFARPSKPHRRIFDLSDAARTVATNLHEFAALQRVRIELITPDEPCPVESDPKHVQTALTSLLRNAIEAAPEDGWARVTVELGRERRQVIVEDSGPGPTLAQRDHLFDPFFSGRLAGRGCGLGLPTAWRLAKEQGGDVAFDPHTDSPARFVLTLPAATDSYQLVDRISA